MLQISQSIVIRAVAICMLLLAFADLPYAYYQILRWVVCGVAAYSAYQSYEKRQIFWAWVLGIIAILFNPIAPIHFARETWQFLDVASAVVIFLSLFSRRSLSSSNS